MHWKRLNGLFHINYMYFDLDVDKDYIADSLFCKRKIPVKFRDEMNKKGDKYRVIFCKIPKKYKESFEEALNEIPKKMELLGHLDYLDYCNSVMNMLEEKH